MGDKRSSIRTLASGEKVRHLPDGTMHLIREESALRARHNARADEHRARHRELKDAHAQRVQAKVVRSRANGLPGEKSPI
jgi:hypothetical protein